MKVLIMVLSSLKHPYNKLMYNQYRTWDRQQVENMGTLYYVGNKIMTCESKLTMLSKVSSRLDIACSDEYDMMHWKFKRALDEILQWEFDYIFRTNSSTYVCKDKLYAYLLDKPREKYYAGEVSDGFISGTGAIISKDLAYILQRELTDEPTPAEDSLIGTILRNNGIEMQQGPLRENYNFDEPILREAVYYRCKSTIKAPNSADLNRNYDILAMNTLADCLIK